MCLTASLGALQIACAQTAPTTNAYPIPAFAQGRVFNNVVMSPSNKVIALTFDDGPWPGITEPILSILAKYNVKATFFQVGTQIAANPALGRAVRDAGHAIGNHTWSHQQTPPDPLLEVQRADATIQSIYGGPTGLFRAPFGNFTNGVVPAALAEHKAVIVWNCNPKDWTLPGTSAIVNTAVMGATPGGIIVLHDGGGDRSQTIAALPTIISSLQAKGYHFVTVPELLAQANVAPKIVVTTPRADKIYSSLSVANGTASGNLLLKSVRASIRRNSDYKYWNGTSWALGYTTFAAQGLEKWTATLPPLLNGKYLFQASVTDSANHTTYSGWGALNIDTSASSVVTN